VILAAPPIEDMLAFRVMVEVETPVAAEVVRVGVVILFSAFANASAICPYPAPVK